jgi:hypothetical protein
MDKKLCWCWCENHLWAFYHILGKKVLGLGNVITSQVRPDGGMIAHLLRDAQKGTINLNESKQEENQKDFPSAFGTGDLL